MKRQKHTILLVEDDPNDQSFIEMAFRSNGVTDPIRIVPDGAEAMAYLNGEGAYADRQQFEFPSFILTDLKMPRVDGFGVLEALRNDPELSVVPTIVLSASSDEDDIKRAYQLGAKSYLVKPQALPELCNLLKKFYDYWTACEVPQVNESGRQLPTKSQGKLGERFSHHGT